MGIFRIGCRQQPPVVELLLEVRFSRKFAENSRTLYRRIQPQQQSN